MQFAKFIFIPLNSEKADIAGISEQIIHSTKKSKLDISYEIFQPKGTTEITNHEVGEGLNLSVVSSFSTENNSEFVVLFPLEHLKNFGSVLTLIQNAKKHFSDNFLFASSYSAKGKISSFFKSIFSPLNIKGKLSGIYFMNKEVAEKILPQLNPNNLTNNTEAAFKAQFNEIKISEITFQGKLPEGNSSENKLFNSAKAKSDWFFFQPIRELKKSGIEKNAILTNPNHSIYRLLFFSLCVMVAFMFPYFSFDFGITMDEPEDHGYFKKVLQYFLTFGEDKSCLDTNYRVNSHLINYGPFVNLLCVIFEKYLSPFGVYESRHFIISLFGVLGVVYTGLVAKKLGNWAMAVVAVIFITATPLYFGHSMNNQKDLPFAALYIVSVFFMIKFVIELPKPTLRTWFFMTLAFGITLSIRIGGLLVLAYTGLFTLIFLFSQLKKEGFGKTVKTGFSIGWKLILVILFSYTLGIIFWPYALEAPIDNPMKALSSFENFSLVHIWEIFEGERFYMKDFPWYYIPKSIYITVPLFVLGGFFIAFPLIGVLMRKYNRSALGIILFVMIFPIAYIIYKEAVVYSSWRHVLFVYPPMVILSVAGWQGLTSLFKNNILKIAIISIGAILLIRVVYWMGKNHPYQYVYYNEIAGGVNGAYGNYETDYWCQSPREATEWLAKNGHFVKDKKTVVCSNNVSASVDNYIPAEYKDSTFARWSREGEWGKNEWDYAIWTTRTLSPTQLKNGSFPPPGTIHVIKVDDVPLAAIVKRENKTVYEGLQKLGINQFREADSLLKLAVAYDPKSEEAWRSLALAQLNLGQYDSSIINLNKSLEIMPENSYAYTYLGFAYMRKNDAPKAQEMLKKAIVLRPNNNLAYETSGDISANNGDFADALKAYEKALQYSGNQEVIFDKIGRINFTRYNQNPGEGTKYLEEALRYFGAALEKNPKNPSYYYNVAIVLDKQGRKQEAQQYFDQYKNMSGK